MVTILPRPAECIHGEMKLVKYNENKNKGNIILYPPPKKSKQKYVTVIC